MSVMLLQTADGAQKFFNKEPGTVMTVTWGIPELVDGATEQKWRLDGAKQGTFRIDGVRYERLSNAGRVARLRGVLSGMNVDLWAYANYRTAVIVVKVM